MNCKDFTDIEVAKHYAEVHYNEISVAEGKGLSLFEAVINSVILSGIARNLSFLDGITLCNNILKAVIDLSRLKG